MNFQTMCDQGSSKGIVQQGVCRQCHLLLSTGVLHLLQDLYCQILPNTDISCSSSTDPGSGGEGSLSGVSKLDQSHLPPVDPNHPSTSTHIHDSHGSHAASISRPSSVSTTSPFQDSETYPGKLSGRSSELPWTKRPDQPSEAHHGRSPFASNPQQAGAHAHPYAYHSMSTSSPSLSPHEAQFKHSRRRPLGPTDHIPSFRHQDSSISSVLSSQSSTSTAATSNSTYRNAEEENHPYVTLPPISAVTGLSRDGQGHDSFATRSDSGPIGGGAPLTYMNRRSHALAAPFASGMKILRSCLREESNPCAPFGKADLSRTGNTKYRKVTICDTAWDFRQNGNFIYPSPGPANNANETNN